MRELPAWRRYLRFWGPDPLRDVDDEVAFHLSMKRDELLAAGIPPERIDAEIARAFGDRNRITEELKSIGMQRSTRYRRAMFIDDVVTDLRHAWRSFRRRPAVPAIIVGTLALAIGAGTAVFTLFDAVLLNPLAVGRPDELVQIREELGGGRESPGLSYPMSRFLREQSTSTTGIVGWTTMEVGLGWADIAEQVSAGFVTGNYFSVLGVQPQHGRLFGDGDETVPGTTPLLVLSDALWRRMFGGDPAVVGRTVAINEMTMTVIGVARPGFRGTSLAAPVDLWMPITMVRAVARSGLLANEVVFESWFFSMFAHIARVPADGSVDRALAELSTLYSTGMTNAPARGGGSGVVIGENAARIVGQPIVEVAAGRSRDTLIRFMTALGLVVAITLTIACVNVANLLLMRSRERGLEMTIRAAVGASSSRVARQLVLESVLMALAAGVVGAAVGMVAVRLFTTFSLPGGIALSGIDLTLDDRVLAFTAVTALVCAVSFGLAPVVSAARTNPMNALRSGRGGVRSGRLHGRGVLIAAQVALSLVLLVAGSLFAGSLRRAMSVDMGFRSAGVATVSVGLRQYGYSQLQAETFVQSVIDAVRARPGIQYAAAATRVPIEPDAFRMPIIPTEAMALTTIPDPEVRAAAPRIPLVGITPGYLDAMDIERIEGRSIEWSDRGGAPLVAIVTRNTADRLWPGENPIGKRFVPMFGESYAVIGVADDAHITNLNEREPHIFVPLIQMLDMTGMDRIRFLAAGTNASASLDGLRDVIRDIDPRLPLFDARDVREQVDTILMPQRFGMTLIAVLGGVALMICGIGIHAVAAYDVATRRRELGIRAALGAERRDLVHTVIRRAALAICAGVILGLTAAAFATQGLRSLLFGITPYEPRAYIAAAVLLGLVAVIASWIPARRAARTDPLTIVRDD